MGLDNFWASEPNEFVSFEPELKVTGGIFSRYGQGSFRGKVYTEFFSEELDTNLHDDMDPEQIREIADRFKHMDWKEEWSEMEHSGKRYPSTEQEFEDLKRMFIAYSQTNFKLFAWY